MQHSSRFASGSNGDRDRNDTFGFIADFKPTVPWAVEPERREKEGDHIIADML
jgi:hypothetical protein